MTRSFVLALNDIDGSDVRLKHESPKKWEETSVFSCLGRFQLLKIVMRVVP